MPYIVAHAPPQSGSPGWKTGCGRGLPVLPGVRRKCVPGHVGSVQGLPPLDRDKRHQWVQDIISRGTNLVTVHGDTVIGHASLFSMPVDWVEYFIFIHQDFQRQGIGTAITLYVIDWARQENLSAIWLTVETKNYIAISLYNKVGFKRIASSISEWEMILTLKE